MILTPEPPVSVAESVIDTVRRKIFPQEPLLHLIDATGFVVSGFTVVVVVAGFVVVVVAVVVVVGATVVEVVVVEVEVVVVVVDDVVELDVVVLEPPTERSMSDASSTVREPALERASPNDTPVGT